MPVNNLFGGGLAQMSKALDLRSQRQNLIQSNIANLETPGYKVQDFPFDKVMAKVQNQKSEIAQTHQKHMGIDPVNTAVRVEVGRDNRPVDLDEEMVKLAENQLMYRITAKLVTKKLDGLKYVIDEGGK